MKLEQCKVGMQVFQKEYERIEGFVVPSIGKKGVIKSVNKRSVRVLFDDGTYKTFSEYPIEGFAPFATLRHISSEKEVLKGREYVLEKIGIMRRLEVVKIFLGELRTSRWNEIGETLTFLEKKITEVVGK